MFSSYNFSCALQNPKNALEFSNDIIRNEVFPIFFCGKMLFLTNSDFESVKINTSNFIILTFLIGMTMGTQWVQYYSTLPHTHVCKKCMYPSPYPRGQQL